uniref:Uncharacterized protein n=1 Tax=Chromera velia CCMP2878 TaxID=1169474 RepID=A0A0G4I8H2_9ALVE|eukprot:Cvel_11957.t1-p1 / transcript=Cvel_11957.t1 / gene=Cvel_11957 / organism=Chromera_velia_CCMP2878 / gene_product=hypothetical protein / transcript_product=hypothetical protein / location=Cvel_scaffold766:31297-33947(+) / protein_length=282 / sequence_SO=supercontig / SO=protein_coding / is_pseudo=false
MKHLHPKKECLAANVRCSFEGCGMVGHYMKCCPKNPKRKQQQAKAAGPWATPLQSQSSRSGRAGVSSKAGRERFVRVTLRNAQQSGWCKEPEWEDVCVSVPKTPVECFVGMVGDDGECIADSGCSLGLFTPAFKKFVVSSEDRKLKRRGSATGTRKHIPKPCEEPPVDGGEERERESEGPEGSFNADIYHNLKDMKRKGIGGVHYVENPVDVDVVAEQAAEEAAIAKFVRWFEMSKSQRERHMRERRKRRRELKEARIAKAFDSHLEIACAVMKAEKARKLL